MRGRMCAARDPDAEPRGLDEGGGGLAGRSCSMEGGATRSEAVSCVEEQRGGAAGALDCSRGAWGREYLSESESTCSAEIPTGWIFIAVEVFLLPPFA